jgi:replication factor C subunit 3/5
MCTCLKHVATKERITLNDELNVSIARESDRNLRRAILMLECSRVAAAGDVLPTGRSRSAPRITALSKDSIVPKTDWEMYISQLVADVKEEQSPARLMAAREKLYELLVNCIPASVIMKTMAKELVMTLEDDLKYEVLEAAAFYEHRIALGSKDIFHLEAFLAKFMAIYKRYLNDMFG